jgi:Mce-associated membrane protein
VTTAIGDQTTGDDLVDDTPGALETHDAPSEAAADASLAGAQQDDETSGQDPRTATSPGHPGGRWVRIVAFGLLPAVAFVLAGGAGYLKWQGDSARDAAAAQSQSVAAATEGTISLLSYQADSVDKQLTAARDRLTGTFRDSYSALIHDVVIPGAQQKQISAVATVPAAASISATPNHAVVLVFVDQSVTVGTDAPTSTASSVKVTLDKIGERWLISDFTPV